jgi:hypothetical protein
MNERYPSFERKKLDIVYGDHNIHMLVFVDCIYSLWNAEYMMINNGTTTFFANGLTFKHEFGCSQYTVRASNTTVAEF